MSDNDPKPTVTDVAVKNYRPVAALSHETEAFTATIYLDGVRAGRVSNEGTGGCNRYEFEDRSQRVAFEAYARAWGKEHGETFEPEGALILQLCEDIRCRRLSRDFLARGAVGLLLIHQKPGWFPGVPNDGRPDFYEKSYVVGVPAGQEPAVVAARHDAAAWRVIPTD